MNKVNQDNFKQDKYKYGFVTDIESEKIPKGLNEDIVKLISKKKEEPEWMLEWRLKAFERLQHMSPPKWVKAKFDDIDFQDLYYYASPKNFKEKPDYETAKQFIDEGNFLWNAGIFIWSSKTVLNAFETAQPEMYHLFTKGNLVYNTPDEDQFISTHYEKAENISVDYAIMEVSTDVYVISATFDWNDLGTWGSLYDKISDNSSENAVVNARLLATV